MARFGFRKITWSPEEEETIRRLWPTHNCEEIAKILANDKRGFNIYDRGVRKLGLPKRGPGWNKFTFTEEQTETLRRLWENYRNEDIAREIGCPLWSVTIQAEEIGLPSKRNAWVRFNASKRRRKMEEDLPPPMLAPGHMAADDFSYRVLRNLLAGGPA